MSLRDDLVMRGYEHQCVGWYTEPGYNMIGNLPNTDNAACYCKNYDPSTLGITLRAILRLLALFVGSEHTPSNTRAHMRHERLNMKSKSIGQWQSIGVSPVVSGYNTPKTTLFVGSETEDRRTNSDGSAGIKPPGNNAMAWHG